MATVEGKEPKSWRRMREKEEHTGNTQREYSHRATSFENEKS